MKPENQMKKKNKQPKKLLRAYAEPRYNSMLNSRMNPFFSTRKKLPTRNNMALMHPIFLKPMKTNSALNPFTIFGNNKLKKNVKVSKTNMTWDQVKKKFPKMNPFGDADKDGVENWMDCRPLNKNMQGKGHKKSKSEKAFIKVKNLEEQRRAEAKSSDLQLSMSKLKRQEERVKGAAKEVEKTNREEIIKRERERLKGLSSEELLQAKDVKEFDTPQARREERVAQYGLAKEGEKLAAQERKVDRDLKKAETYQRIKDTKTYKTLGKVENVIGDIGDSRLTKGAKAMITQRQSKGWDVATAKTKRATLGLLGELTTSGGMFEDGADDYIGIEPMGGLARVRQKLKQTRGKVGRPSGSYKYGMPVQQLRAIERERKHQLAMQRLAAEQRMMDIQAQKMQQQVQQVAQASPQQAQQMPTQVQMYDEQMAMDQMSAGSDGFLTPEMSEPRQMPMQMQAPNSFQPQGQVPQAIAGSQIPEWSKIQQPKKGNPWNLIAKWRPNFGQNTFKNTPQQPKPNLLTNAKRLLFSARPATTANARPVPMNTPRPTRDPSITNTYNYNVTEFKRQNPQMGGDQ
jgi:hypothetical protein